MSSCYNVLLKWRRERGGEEGCGNVGKKRERERERKREKERGREGRRKGWRNNKEEQVRMVERILYSRKHSRAKTFTNWLKIQ